MASTQEQFIREIGQRLRSARLKAGLTQEELGNMIGMSQDGISRMENGKQSIDVSRLAEVAVICNIPVVSLIQDSESLAQSNLFLTQLDPQNQQRAAQLLKLLLDVQEKVESENSVHLVGAEIN